MAQAGDFNRSVQRIGSSLAGSDGSRRQDSRRAGLYPGSVPPGLSPIHLLVIFVVALLVLGPDKMPDAVRKGARLLGEARQWSARISDEVQSAVSLQTQDPSPIAETSGPSGASTVNATVSDPAPTVAEGLPPGAEPSGFDAGSFAVHPRSSEPGPGASHLPSVAKEHP